jgi:hypothetical protein
MVDQEVVDLVLSDGRRAGGLAGVNPDSGRGCLIEQLTGHEAVVDDHVTGSERPEALPRYEARITRAGSDEVHLAAHRVDFT